MNPTLKDIQTRLLRGESLEYISIHTGVDQNTIKKVFKLNK